MKFIVNKIYEIDIEKVKDNILLEVGRYVSCNGGYSRELLEHNIKEILEQGYKELPSSFTKKENNI